MSKSRGRDPNDKWFIFGITPFEKSITNHTWFKLKSNFAEDNWKGLFKKRNQKK